MIASQRFRPDVVERRDAFLVEVKDIPAERLVFVDESGVVRGMRAVYGYAPRGERCVETAPFRVGKRLNLLGWMRQDSGGVTGVEGSVNAEVFERFVAESLVPSLKPGDVVIWDNARIHAAVQWRGSRQSERACSRSRRTARTSTRSRCCGRR